MKVIIGEHNVCVQREEGDPRARNESHFWFLMRQHLNGKPASTRHVQGSQNGREQWIKRRIVADGHLVDGEMYYVRTRKAERQSDGSQAHTMIWDGNYAIRNLAADHNSGAPVMLNKARE